MEKCDKIIKILLLVFITTSFILPSYASIGPVKSYDLSVVGVAPWNYQHYDQGYEKFVPGYRVLIANYGEAHSPEAKMTLYIKTYDGKLLKRNFTVPPIRPGYMKGLKFSMANGTDGSFKSGYVSVTTPQRWYWDSYGVYYESTSKNNARNFGLKSSMAQNSNLNVDEYVKVNQPVEGENYFYTTSYNSPATSQQNITQIYCMVEPWPPWQNVKSINVHVPGYMHENVTVKLDGCPVCPTTWTDDTITYVGDWKKIYEISIKITGESLETKDTFREPLEVIDSSGVNLANNVERYIYERYYSPFSLQKYSYISPVSSSYQVHNNNVTRLVIKGQPQGQYIASWFIKPTDDFTSIKSLDPSGSISATNATNGFFASSVRSRSGPVGFQIDGTNLQGFSNFKTYGFLPWTWKDQY